MDELDCTNTAVELTASATNALGYSWDNGTAGATTTATDGTTYTVTITGVGDCQTTSSVTFTKNVDVPATPVISDNDGCDNAVTFTVDNYDAALTYAWKLDGTDVTATSSYTVAGAENAQTYNVSVIAKAANGCESAAGTGSQTYKLTPVIGSVTAPQVCDGSDMTFTVTATNAATYRWTGDADNASTAATAVVVSVVGGETYRGTVVAISDANCETAPFDYSQTAFDTPVITNVASTPVCPGQSITFTANSTDAVSYSWTGDADNASTTASASTVAVTSGATYQGTVTAISADGCPSEPFDYSQTAYTTPATPVVTNLSGCDNPVRFTIENYDAAASYTWTIDGASVAVAGDVYQVVSPTEGTVYQVEVVAHANGCPSEAGGQQQQFMSRPKQPMLTTNDGCDNEVIFTVSNYSAGYTYRWNLDGSDLTVTGDHYQVSGATDGQTYAISVVAVSYGMCESQTGQATQTYKLNPVVTTKPVDAVCSPAIVQLDNAIDWTATSADRIQYYDNADMTSINTGGMIAEVGTHRVYAVGISNSNCLSQPMPIDVTINEMSLLYQKEFELCLGEDLDIEVEGLGVQAAGYGYELTDEEGHAVSGKPYAGGYVWPMTPEGSAHYTLTVRNGACSETSDLSVVVHALPSFEVGQSQPEEATIVPLTTSGQPYTFYLDGAENPLETLVFEVAPGDHYVTVYDIHNCEATVEFVIDDSKTPIIIPNFFTPDGDGVNDVWKIGNIEKYPNAVIRIYDRFSKLLVEYDGTFEGWDGMYNGHQCVSTDYWYYIDIPALGRPISGHLTLYRGQYRQ